LAARRSSPMSCASTRPSERAFGASAGCCKIITVHRRTLRAGCEELQSCRERAYSGTVSVKHRLPLCGRRKAPGKRGNTI
jgi:hypothetical protein